MTSSPHVIRYAIVIADLEYPAKGTVGMITDHPFDNIYDLITFLPLGAKTPVRLRNEDVERQQPLWQPPASALSATRIEYRTLIQFHLGDTDGPKNADKQLNKFLDAGWELVQIGNPVVVNYDDVTDMCRQVILRQQL